MRGFRLIAAMTMLVAATAAARADGYPVGGTWTYDDASAKGPAKECGPRIMTFSGDVRHDTGTSAPDYRNVSVQQTGADTWRLVDTFYTVQVRGNLHYTLRKLDADHIELTFDKGGRRFLLRRCAAQ